MFVKDLSTTETIYNPCRQAGNREEQPLQSEEVFHAESNYNPKKDDTACNDDLYSDVADVVYYQHGSRLLELFCERPALFIFSPYLSGGQKEALIAFSEVTITTHM